MYPLFIHSGYFYSPLTPLPLRGAPNYSSDTVSELTCRSATGKGHQSQGGWGGHDQPRF